MTGHASLKDGGPFVFLPIIILIDSLILLIYLV